MGENSSYFKVQTTVPAVAARINCVCERARLIPGTVGRVLKRMSSVEARLFLAEIADPVLVRIPEAGDFVVSAGVLEKNSIWFSNTDYQKIRRRTAKS